MITLNISSNVVLYLFFAGVIFLLWSLHNWKKSLEDLDWAEEHLRLQEKKEEELDIRISNAKRIIEDSIRIRDNLKEMGTKRYHEKLIKDIIDRYNLQ